MSAAKKAILYKKRRRTLTFITGIRLFAFILLSILLVHKFAYAFFNKK